MGPIQKNDIGNVYIFDSAPDGSNLKVEHLPEKRPLSEECFPNYDSDLEKNVAEIKSKISLPESGQFDGTLLSLDYFYINGIDRVMGVKDVDYSTYQALKMKLQKNERGTLTRVVPLIAFTETKDNYFVFGHRSTAHMGGRYLPPAGFSDHEGKVNSSFFIDLSLVEIKEELGIDLNPQECRYVGISSGDDSRNLTVLTLSSCAYSAKELNNQFNSLNKKLISLGQKVEHDHLIYLPNDRSSVAKFLSGKFTGSLNDFEGILFNGGLCTRGPREIKDKPYGQIGNGIGGLLSLMQQRISEGEYRNLVEEVNDSGMVNSVIHMSLDDLVN